MVNVSVQWVEKLYFQGINGQDQKVPVEAARTLGGEGRGFLPSELLLTALGGCTGMDIISLLKKDGTLITAFNIELSGIKKKEHPKAFQEITATYRLDGNIDAAKALSAVSSSYKKYSVVANSLNVAITFRVFLNGQEITGDQ